MTDGGADAHLAQRFALAGKVAVVTGGNRGIGRAIAIELASLGAAVMIGARDPGTAAAVVAAIGASGGHVAAAPLALKDEASVAALMRTTVDRFGSLDILVNNAGVFPAGRILDTTADEWDAIQATNARGTFLCLREAARTMVAAGTGGRIITISSMGSVLPAAPGRFAYGASKALVNRLTEDAAAEFGCHGILINAVLPGPILTEAMEMDDLATQRLVAAITRRIPAGRYGEMTDIAAAVAFLAGPSAAFITGQKLLVDGGFTLGG